jgi:hypothetical protein
MFHRIVRTKSCRYDTTAALRRPRLDRAAGRAAAATAGPARKRRRCDQAVARSPHRGPQAEHAGPATLANLRSGRARPPRRSHQRPVSVDLESAVPKGRPLDPSTPASSGSRALGGQSAAVGDMSLSVAGLCGSWGGQSGPLRRDRRCQECSRPLRVREPNLLERAAIIGFHSARNGVRRGGLAACGAGRQVRTCPVSPSDAGPVCRVAACLRQLHAGVRCWLGRGILARLTPALPRYRADVDLSTGRGRGRRQADTPPPVFNAALPPAGAAGRRLLPRRRAGLGPVPSARPALRLAVIGGAAEGAGSEQGLPTQARNRS